MWTMLLLKLLSRRRAAATAAGDGTAGTDAERLYGCGWFDSSHALQTGLVMTEHAVGDAATAALPLADWLALQPAGAACAELCA